MTSQVVGQAFQPDAGAGQAGKPDLPSNSWTSPREEGVLDRTLYNEGITAPPLENTYVALLAALHQQRWFRLLRRKPARPTPGGRRGVGRLLARGGAGGRG